MLLSDDELRYREVNAAACRLVGRSRESLLELSIGDLTPAADAGELAGRVEAFRRDGTLAGRVRVTGPGDEPVDIEFSSFANVVPGLHLTVAVPLDGEAETVDEEPAAIEAGGEPLSPRERQVLTALALGQTGVEIAEELRISPETVRNHVRNARAKLGARTRAQAIARALQTGEINT